MPYTVKESNTTSVFVNVCPSGTPQLDNTGRPIPCTFGTDSCDSSHWCHLGLVPDEYQCCPGTPTVPGACQGLPFADGELGASAPPATRYYYDQSTMSCKQFIYNGRKGNQNNFLTKEDCEATCNGDSLCDRFYSITIRTLPFLLGFASSPTRSFKKIPFPSSAIPFQSSRILAINLFRFLHRLVLPERIHVLLLPGAILELLPIRQSAALAVLPKHQFKWSKF